VSVRALATDKFEILPTKATDLTKKKILSKKYGKSNGDELPIRK